MFKRRKILFKDIDINDLISILPQKLGSLPKEHDGRLMIPGTESQRNTKGLNRTSGHTRIF